MGARILAGRQVVKTHKDVRADKMVQTSLRLSHAPVLASRRVVKAFKSVVQMRIREDRSTSSVNVLMVAKMLQVSSGLIRPGQGTAWRARYPSVLISSDREGSEESGREREHSGELAAGTATAVLNEKPHRKD